MKKLLTFSIIWLGSIALLVTAQAKPLKTTSTVASYLSQMPAFTGFWQIKLTKSFEGISIIGYKKEIFDTQKGSYVFEYQFFKPKNLSIPFDTSAKGQILFDQDKIKQIQILLGEQFLLAGGTETGQKLRLTLTQIGDPNPIFSKIRDLQKFQFNIFLPYILPYMNLEPGKTYSFDTIDLQSFNQNQIKTTTVKVILRTPTLYQLKYSDFTVDLFYNQQGQLIAYKMPFLKGVLITSPAKQLEIEQKIKGVSLQQNDETKADDKIETQTQVKADVKTEAETETQTELSSTSQLVSKSETEVNAQKSKAAIEAEAKIKSQPLGQTGENPTSPQSPSNTFANLQNLDIQEQIQKLVRKKQKKTCPLVIK